MLQDPQGKAYTASEEEGLKPLDVSGGLPKSIGDYQQVDRIQSLQYLTQLHLAHKVQVKDNTLSTTDLSQGQRKRLALLTAYLEDRPIYLFDEWAADQDPFFKELFYYQLLPELKAKGKTVIAITHDDRYYHVADRVIKMEMGKITKIEPGSSYGH